MSKTVGALSAKNVKLEVSPDNATWINISGSSNAITPSGGKAKTGEMNVFGDSAPVTVMGNSDPVELTIVAIYTEVDEEAVDVMGDAYTAGVSYYLRYSPKGGASGTWMFTSDEGNFIQAVTPEVNADDTKPVTVKAVFRCGKMTKSVVTP